MGNFCVPKKIVFTKISSDVKKQTDSFQLPRRRQKSSISNYSELQSNIKDAFMESNIFMKETSNRRLSILSNESIRVSRSCSNDEINEINEITPASCSLIKISTNLSDGDIHRLNQNRKLEIRFINICFTKTKHKKTDVEEINAILENASKNNFAKIIDLKNVENNNAISVAILDNNYSLLNCLIRFMPDFPEFISVDNVQLPLVQVAAASNPIDLEDENMLTVILRIWISDYVYHSIALRNITTKCLDNCLIHDILMDRIFNNDSIKVNFQNFELLLQLYKILQLKGLVNVIEHSQISLICSVISINEIFWTEERKNLIIKNSFNKFNKKSNSAGMIVMLYESTK